VKGAWRFCNTRHHISRSPWRLNKFGQNNAKFQRTYHSNKFTQKNHVTASTKICAGNSSSLFINLCWRQLKSSWNVGKIILARRLSRVVRVVKSRKGWTLGSHERFYEKDCLTPWSRVLIERLVVSHAWYMFSHVILLHLIAVITFCIANKLWSSSSCSLLHPSVTPSLLGSKYSPLQSVLTRPQYIFIP
jgi:hypothetical protein